MLTEVLAIGRKNSDRIVQMSIELLQAAGKGWVRRGTITPSQAVPELEELRDPER